MKTIANRALYSAVLITVLLIPAASFAQSWEPENVWQVGQENWNVSPQNNNPSSSTVPSSQIRPTIPPSIDVEEIKTSERCKPITIKAKILDYTSISQVFLYYASGNLNYTMLPMNSPPQAPNKFIATLPETATQGDYIDYYIEAFNSQKTLVTSSGNALNPTRIFLTGECPDNVPDDINSTNQSISYDIFSNHTTRQTERSHSATQQSSSQQALPAKPNTSTKPHTILEDVIDDKPKPEDKPSYPNFQFSVMLGTGVGIVGDKTENCDSNAKCMPIGGWVSSISTGPAPLPLHLRTSAMFNLPKHFQIGVYLRGQLINIVKDSLTPPAKANVKNPEQYNIMVGLTARYLIRWEQPYRLYIGLELGWGGANATVDMGRSFNNFKDIYLYKGPWHVAPEIGFLWNFHKNIGLAFELTIPIVFPERPSAFFDLSIGPYIQF